MKDGGWHENAGPFSEDRPGKTKKEVQAAGTKDGRDNKNTQKILEMHELFGYNVTIMYSKKYSEL